MVPAATSGSGFVPEAMGRERESPREANLCAHAPPRGERTKRHYREIIRPDRNDIKKIRTALAQGWHAQAEKGQRKRRCVGPLLLRHNKARIIDGRAAGRLGGAGL